MEISQTHIRNKLLRMLSADLFVLIVRDMELLTLPLRFQFSEPNSPSAHVYFLESGIGSIVAVSPEQESVEVGIFGSEGMTPSTLALGSASNPYDIYMQVAGSGYRIETAKLVSLMAQDASLTALLLKYAYAQSVQTSCTAFFNARGTVEGRLARWILMCHDRIDGDEVQLTHEFLSMMLGVRRPSVTNALHVLEGEGLIYSPRGSLVIRNRPGLLKVAAHGYGVPEAEYARIMTQA